MADIDLTAIVWEQAVLPPPQYTTIHYLQFLRVGEQSVLSAQMGKIYVAKPLRLAETFLVMTHGNHYLVKSLRVTSPTQPQQISTSQTEVPTNKRTRLTGQLFP